MQSWTNKRVTWEDKSKVEAEIQKYKQVPKSAFVLPYTGDIDYLLWLQYSGVWGMGD